MYGQLLGGFFGRGTMPIWLMVMLTHTQPPIQHLSLAHKVPQLFSTLNKSTQLLIFSYKFRDSKKHFSILIAVLEISVLIFSGDCVIIQ
jgi:hypothetical protein